MSQERAVIRQAEVTDLSKVETVARATWPVAYTGIIPDEVQRRLLDSWYSRESLSRALRAPGSRFFVAELSGDVVGFAQFVRRSAESVELTRIYVLPGRQRSGIGMRLLEAGLTEFAGEGLKRLTVEVERDNDNGRRFYELAGFVEPRELTREVQGYVLTLVEYRRPILGRLLRGPSGSMESRTAAREEFSPLLYPICSPHDDEVRRKMTTYYAVFLRPGSLWDPEKAVRQQPFWDEHARYMDSLFANGMVVLGGPFADRTGSMVIVKAQSATHARELYRDDPWTMHDVLVVAEVKEWIIFLDAQNG